jgi:hypothetical protein
VGFQVSLKTCRKPPLTPRRSLADSAAWHANSGSSARWVSEPCSPGRRDRGRNQAFEQPMAQLRAGHSGHHVFTLKLLTCTIPAQIIVSAGSPMGFLLQHFGIVCVGNRFFPLVLVPPPFTVNRERMCPAWHDRLGPSVVKKECQVRICVDQPKGSAPKRPYAWCFCCVSPLHAPRKAE